MVVTEIEDRRARQRIADLFVGNVNIGVKSVEKIKTPAPMLLASYQPPLLKPSTDILSYNPLSKSIFFIAQHCFREVGDCTERNEEKIADNIIPSRHSKTIINSNTRPLENNQIVHNYSNTRRNIETIPKSNAPDVASMTRKKLVPIKYKTDASATFIIQGSDSQAKKKRFLAKKKQVIEETDEEKNRRVREMRRKLAQERLLARQQKMAEKKRQV